MHTHILVYIYINTHSKVFGLKGLHGVVSVATSAKIISENDLAQLIYDSGTSINLVRHMMTKVVN
jgi:hypothetical protein